MKRHGVARALWTSGWGAQREVRMWVRATSPLKVGSQGSHRCTACEESASPARLDQSGDSKLLPRRHASTELGHADVPVEVFRHFDTLWKDFGKAVQSNEPEELSEIYGQLVDLSDQYPRLKLPRTAIKPLLASSGVLVTGKDIYKSTLTQYIELAEKICRDCVPRWKLDLSRGLLHSWMQVFIASRRVKEIEDMLNEMLLTGEPMPNSRTFEYVLYAHSKLKNWDKVAYWLEKMEERKLAKTSGTYKIVIRSLYTQREYGKVLESYESMLDSGFKPCRAVYGMALTAAYELGKHDKANEIVLRANEDRTNAHLPDAAVVEEIKTKGGLAGLIKASESKGTGKLVSPFEVDRMFAVLFDEGKLTEGGAMIELLKDHGFQVDETSYQYFIHFLLGKGRVDMAMTVYYDSVRNHIEPDAHTLHALINKLCENGESSQVQKATGLFNELLRLGQNEPNAKIPQLCLTILTAYVKLNDMASPLRLIKDWQGTGRMPNVSSTTLSNTILAFANSTKSSHNAFIMYDALRGFAPATLDHIAYSRILRHFAARGNVSTKSTPLQHLRYVFRDMQRDGILPGNTLYLSLLNGCKESRDGTRVAWVEEQIRLDAHLDPDSAMMTALMMAYGHTGHFEKCSELLREMIDRDVPILPSTISVVLDNFGYAGKYQAAQSFWARVLAQGYALDKNNYDSYVECLARLGKHSEAVQVVLDQMGLNERPEDASVPRADETTLHMLATQLQKHPMALDHLKARLDKLNASPGLIAAVKVR